MVVQKNHQLTKVYSRKQIDTVICLQMEKTYTTKTPPVILRSPPPRIHYYQNKRLQVNESQYLIPTYS